MPYKDRSKQAAYRSAGRNREQATAKAMAQDMATQKARTGPARRSWLTGG